VTLTYDYKVRDRSGKLVRGKLDAESLPVVAGRLRQMGYLPIEIREASSLDLKREITIPGVSDRVKLKEVSLMSRQLATMVAAGLTLVRSLSALSDQLESKTLRNALLEIRAEVERGSAFSAALERFPKIFSPLYVAMVRAGEASGQLDTVLLKVADQIEKQVELRRKVRSAFSYPSVVVVVVVLVMAALMAFVVPTFKRLYATLHGTLPLPTRIVIEVSNVVASIWALAVVAVVALVALGFRKAITTERGREAFDRFKLRVPVFGSLHHKIALARFATTLSSLLLSGIGVIEALAIAADNVGNAIVAGAARAAQTGVREGRPLAATLASFPVMPTMLTQMVETGEESGTVGDMLAKVAKFYDDEVDATVNSLTALLEPAMIVFMGCCIGLIVVSLYLPMFNYVKLLQGG
jgi:type IV pilus assembly protein PilC